jgi:hypothetical protein
MPATLKLDENGKLDFSGGTLHVISGSDAIVQGVLTRMRLFRGEWYADDEAGVPYRQKVFVKNPNIADIENEFRAVIRNSPGITAVEYVRLTLNGDTREATVSWRATTIDGEAVDDVTEI